ncbi:MAG: T9SS type A sorting domain-containing protein, partial [candidate division WOR-3 bacterium]
IQIQAKIVNEGLNTESFNVEAKIDSAGFTVYADTVPVNNLISDDTVLVSFAPFTTGANNLNYTLTIKTLLPTDVKPTNNFKSLSFTTVEVPRFITVPVSQVMPIIDGFIDTLSEWNDAIKLDASDVFQMHGLLNPPGSAFIYLKYDGDYLYAAVRAPFDMTRTQFDRIFLYFDDNNDGQFPPPGIKKEGRVALYYTSILDIAAFTPIFVDRTLGQTKSVGFPCASAMPLGYEQYEIAIPFGSLDEELDVSFPDTVGFFFQVGDTFANKIEYGGWFPQDNDSIRVPSYYTKLIFPVVAVKEGKKPINIKERLELALNIPNSISKNPEINFTIPYASPVKINLYNVNGVKVANLIDNKFMTPGKYSVKIDRDKLSSGVYFIRLETNTKDITKKLVFVK